VSLSRVQGNRCDEQAGGNNADAIPALSVWDTTFGAADVFSFQPIPSQEETTPYQPRSSELSDPYQPSTLGYTAGDLSLDDFLLHGSTMEQLPVTPPRKEWGFSRTPVTEPVAVSDDNLNDSAAPSPRLAASMAVSPISSNYHASAQHRSVSLEGHQKLAIIEYSTPSQSLPHVAESRFSQQLGPARRQPFKFKPSRMVQGKKEGSNEISPQIPGHGRDSSNEDPHCPPELNTVAWLTNLPVNVTVADITAILRVGKVVAIHINPAVEGHETSAAKVQFFTRAALERLLLQAGAVPRQPQTASCKRNEIQCGHDGRPEIDQSEPSQSHGRYGRSDGSSRGVDPVQATSLDLGNFSHMLQPYPMMYQPGPPNRILSGHNSSNMWPSPFASSNQWHYLHNPLQQDVPINAPWPRTTPLQPTHFSPAAGLIPNSTPFESIRHPTFSQQRTVPHIVPSTNPAARATQGQPSGLYIRGHRVIVRENRHPRPPHHHPYESRVLWFKGPAKMLGTSLHKIFSDNFVFQLERVVRYSPVGEQVFDLPTDSRLPRRPDFAMGGSEIVSECWWFGSLRAQAFSALMLVQHTEGLKGIVEWRWGKDECGGNWE
jgi:hypothetical protein